MLLNFDHCYILSYLHPIYHFAEHKNRGRVALPLDMQVSLFDLPAKLDQTLWKMLRMSSVETSALDS